MNNLLVWTYASERIACDEKFPFEDIAEALVTSLCIYVGKCGRCRPVYLLVNMMPPSAFIRAGFLFFHSVFGCFGTVHFIVVLSC